MRWTEGQSKFRDLALSPVKRGMSLTVALCDDFSGVSTICNALERSRMSTQVLCVFTGNWYNTSTELAYLAGTRPSGAVSWSLRQSLQKLTDHGSRPLTIILKDSHLMSVKDTELFLLSMENVVNQHGLSVRVIMMQRMVSRYCQEKGKGGFREMKWPLLPMYLMTRKTLKALDYFKFERHDLIQLRGRAIPDLFEDTAVSPVLSQVG